MVRLMVAFFEPSRLIKLAVTLAVAEPTFCAMTVESQLPDPAGVVAASTATYGRATRVAPELRPSYASASARAPTPFCSLTTATISEP